MSDEKVRVLSRPKDRSLEAFKEWITNMVRKLNPSAPEEVIPDSEWEADWKTFWSKVPAEDPAPSE